MDGLQQDKKFIDLLKGINDETPLLVSLIMENPRPIGIFNEDGKHVFHNHAYTNLFKAIPDENYSIFSDPIVKEKGILAGIRSSLKKVEIT